MRQEIAYLKKVKTVIPPEGIILASNHDGANMIWISTITQRPMFFGINFTEPRYIPMQINKDEYPYLNKYDSLEKILSNEELFKTKKLYMLDYNIKRWNKILDGKDFSYVLFKKYIKKYKLQKIFEYEDRRVYKLELKK